MQFPALKVRDLEGTTHVIPPQYEQNSWSIRLSSMSDFRRETDANGHRGDLARGHVKPAESARTEPISTQKWSISTPKW